ncbi:hypothetical protein EV2_028814 [Malus domestica]
MHSIKGSWVGQTFALAKNNESEGRRSRIRRSKEERKAMVESFIKKYQNINNGSFPSLNLTHKEVGGSFYTVREIVRDIIQENRVLGPAKFTVEEQQTIDQFWEHNPLGTIAAEPQNSLSISSNELLFVTNQNQGAIEQLVFASDGHLVAPEHQMFENGRIINGTQVEVNDKEFNEPKSTELQANGPVEIEKHVAVESIDSNGHCIGPEYQSFGNGLINGSQIDRKDKEREEQTCTEPQTVEPVEAEKNAEDVRATSKSNVNPLTADVIVETFPLKPVNATPEGLDGRLQEVTDLTKSSEDKGTRGMELAGVDSSQVDRLYSMKSMDDNVAMNLSSPLVENKSSPVDEALGNAIDPSVESSNYSTFNEGIVHETGSTDLNVKSPHKNVPTSESSDQNQLTAGTKADKAPDSLHTKITNGTSGSREQSKTKEVVVIEDEVDVQTSGSLKKGSKPTLDRINLESWEGASKTTRPEGNSLWDVFKAFLEAFVKFWSE